jgi:hypothetical protein
METSCTNIVDVVRVLEGILDALVDNREADALCDAIAFLKERILCIPCEAALEDFYPDVTHVCEGALEDQFAASANSPSLSLGSPPFPRGRTFG